MTARREKSKPQKPQLNKQLEAVEQKPQMENTWMENLVAVATLIVGLVLTNKKRKKEE